MMKNNYYFSRVKWFIYFFILTSPFLYRIRWVKSSVAFLNDDSFKMYSAFQAIFHDSIILFFIVFLGYLSLVIKRTVLRYLLRAGASLIFFVYVMDILVSRDFVTRLTIRDILAYSSYAGEYIGQAYGVFGYVFILLVVISVFLMAVDFDKYTLEKKSDHATFLSVMFIFLASYQFSDNRAYVHSWLYKNVFAYNYSVFSQSKDYSNKFIERISVPDDGVVYLEKSAVRRNIIIVMLESFSSRYSRFFSGIENWTPNLDSIARNNLSFVNFYANGFNTEDGHVAVLTGLLPITSPVDYSDEGGVSFAGFMNYPESLPNIFNRYGYRTEFLTSGDLAFSREGEWAKSIGFDHVEGCECASYKKEQAYYQFDSVPDGALYDRVTERVSEIRNSNQPVLLFVATLSSHHPFVNPENGHCSEEEAFRYADEQLGRFYNMLKQQGFFESGILVITADHHAMVPLTEAEINKYTARRAAARIPLVVCCGDSIRRVEESAFQQTDIYNTLKNFVSKDKTASKWLGDFLNQPLVQPAYILHKRGDERNMVSVFYKDKNLQVVLNGDETCVLEQGNAPHISNEIVHKINYERIMRGKNR